MIRRRVLPFLVIALGLGLLMACALLAPETSFAATHPQKLDAGRPVCTQCHESEPLKAAFKPYAVFDHTDAFVKNHRFQAGRDSAICASCHAQSFCSDCHAGKTMMTPSTKLANRPDRAQPHRAGYLTLHRMEGKLDPGSCFKCHGRANNDKCTACHK